MHKWALGRRISPFPAEERPTRLCPALSRDQYEVLKRFIAANRKLERTLARMRALSLETVLKNLPGVKMRK